MVVIFFFKYLCPQSKVWRKKKGDDSLNLALVYPGSRDPYGDSDWSFLYPFDVMAVF